MYGDGRTEGVSPAVSQPTEVSERGYLETLSAGDSVAQNAEAVKRDECLPENMDVEEYIPSNMDVMERQDGELMYTFYMKKRRGSTPQTFDAGVISSKAASANSSDTSIRTSGRESQGKYSPEAGNDRRKAAQFAVIQSSSAAEDDYHTWIRSADEIKTFDEALRDPEWADYDSFDPDYTAARGGWI